MKGGRQGAFSCVERICVRLSFVGVSWFIIENGVV